MKRTLTIAAFALLVSGTAAFAAAPEVVSKAVASCCQALAACCDGGSCCDEM